MQQLTFMEYDILKALKEKRTPVPLLANYEAVKRLKALGLIKGQGLHSEYKIISGQRYSYRGNTYTL